MVEAILKDHRAAPIGEKEKALLDLVEKVNRAAAEIRREDIESAKRAGWSEEALYDAITVCALFNFYNRWCDAAGVQPLPEAAYRHSARAMAARGYAHEL